MRGIRRRTVLRRAARQLQVHFVVAGRFRQEIQQLRTRCFAARGGGQNFRQMKLKQRISGILGRRIAGVGQRRLQLRSARPPLQHVLRLLVCFAWREHRVRQRVYFFAVHPREQRSKRQTQPQRERAKQQPQLTRKGARGSFARRAWACRTQRELFNGRIFQTFFVRIGLRAKKSHDADSGARSDGVRRIHLLDSSVRGRSLWTWAGMRGLARVC
jgi:hypothetical protein